MSKLPLVLSAATLREALQSDPLTIIDLSSAERYAEGHIPGALHLDAKRLLRGSGDVPNLIPTQEQIQTLVNEFGLVPTQTLIVYDDQYGPWAGRLIWTLHQAGFTRTCWLDGQLQGWLEVGGELEQQPNSATDATDAPITLNLRWRIDKTQLLTRLATGSVAVWDARSPAEFAGEKIINTRRGGHIPGARNLEWSDCFVDGKPGFLRPLPELQALLDQQGWQKTAPLVTHCQTHRRSGLTYIVARALGYDAVQCYDGSWFEWGNASDTLIEGETLVP